LRLRGFKFKVRWSKLLYDYILIMSNLLKPSRAAVFSALTLLSVGMVHAQYYDPYRGSRNQDSRLRAEKRERDSFYDRQVSEIRDTYAQRMNAINSAFSTNGFVDLSRAPGGVNAPKTPQVPTESNAQMNARVFAELKTKAEAGDATAMALVAFNIEEGKGNLTKSIPEARRWYERAANAGDKNALAWMANDTSGRGDGKYDPAAYLKWSMRAVDAGLPAYGELVLDELLEAGLPPKDTQRLALYKKYLELGLAAQEPWALGRWGDHAIRDQLGYNDAAKGAEALIKAAAAGDRVAQSNLGYAYLSGRAVPKDRPKAMALLIAAADQGNGNAMFTMGRYMISKNEGWPYDPKRAAGYLKKLLALSSEANLSRDNVAEIAKALAYCHRPGAANCGEDAKVYFENMSLAAKSGSKIAAHELAYCFSRGIGVARDDGLALREWMALDKAGYPPATYQIGIFAYAGRGTPKNAALAWDYYASAALKGYAPAANVILNNFEDYLKESDPTSEKGTKEQFQQILARNTALETKDPLIWSKEDWAKVGQE
jgi:uncharacterized protein